MGPAKAVDAACASSLVSVHDAVADLQQGKADLAIAGGVQAILNTRIYELRADAMMLSPSGQCKTFDASADGYVRGEGCGVVVLKRLSEAEADGDRIWAVIAGAAVNHGGTGVGLTVPNTPALEQVMEAALSDAGVSPAQIGYVEAHGTGTAVGDPIEINAVANVFGPDRPADRPLLIGSVKTNIGHLESGRRDRRTDQGGPGGESRRHSRTPALSRSQPECRLARAAAEGHLRDDGVAARPRSPPGGRGELFRNLRDRTLTSWWRSTAARPVGTAGAIRGRAPPDRWRSCCLRRSVIGRPIEGLGPRRRRFLPLSAKSDDALRELAERYLAVDRRAERSGLAARIRGCRLPVDTFGHVVDGQCRAQSLRSPGRRGLQ